MAEECRLQEVEKTYVFFTKRSLFVLLHERMICVILGKNTNCRLVNEVWKGELREISSKVQVGVTEVFVNRD